MKKIIAIIVVFELVVICAQIVQILIKRGSVSGISVSAINKESVVFDDGDLYEPKPGIFPQNTPTNPPEEVRYSINADSINSMKNYALDKPKDTFRIVALGDSYTYGLYVNTSENWPSLLESELNLDLSCQNYQNFEVLNLGVFGYDAKSSVERFVKRGLKYKPDLVIWYHTNLGRLSELMNPLVEKYINEDRAYELTEDGVRKRNELWLKVRDEIIEKVGMDNIYRLQKENIERLYANYDGQVLHFNLPRMASEEKRVLKEVSGRQNIYLTEVSDFYLQDGYFKVDMHPNKLGHEIIAKDLFEYLKRNIIDCN